MIMVAERMFPAIPPDDYKGTIADWIVALTSRGLLDIDGDDWYGDVELPESVYDEILTECEE